MASEHESLLQGQMTYYQARAGEYDEWWQRQGRYDHGATWNNHWVGEVEELEQHLRHFNPIGQVLELACGTGWWTEQLVQYADTLTAVDASSEVLAINQQRLAQQRAKIDYIQTDLFTWQPPHQYDVVFFSFWLSHVPPERFAAFWEFMRRALKPDGRVFFIDSLGMESMTAKDQTINDSQTFISRRRLNDGREFHIIKIFYDSADLIQRLRTLGWQMSVHTTTHYFLYGTGH